MKKFEEIDLLKILKAAVVLSNQKTVASNLGVSQQYLNDVLHGRRPIAETLYDAMGYERISYFVEKKKY